MRIAASPPILFLMILGFEVPGCSSKSLELHVERLCKFPEPAEPVCELDLPDRATLWLEEVRARDQDDRALCARRRDIQAVRAIEELEVELRGDNAAA